MNQKWSEMSSLNKFATVVTVVSSVALLVLIVLDLAKIWEPAANYTSIPFTFFLAADAVLLWDSKRSLAYLSLGLTALMLVRVVLQFVL